MFFLNFLADQHAVNLGSQGALKGNVRGGSTHESNEVIVFSG
jgi:hypothetical protein